MLKLLFSLGLIAFGLTLGYSLQRLVEKGTIRLPVTIPELRKLLQKIGLLFFMSISFMGAIWIIKVDNLRIAALPFLGVFILLLGGVMALGAARIFSLTRKQTGSFYACGSFTNIGSIGALVVFMFLGEKGFALVPLYKLFEEVIYFVIGFPITKYFSSEETEKEAFLTRLEKVFTDIFVLTALLAIFTGGTLNVLGIPRPSFFNAVNSMFIPTGTVILLISIGLAMRFSGVKKYLKECLVIGSIKFILLPLTAFIIGYFIGFAKIDNGLPLKVVLIVASMPVAFIALIPPSIYDLDMDLSNACWLITTLALVFVLPVIYFLIRQF